MLRHLSLFIALMLLSLSPAAAQEDRVRFGGDEYVGGNQSTISSPVARDAFAAGFNVEISAPVAGDAHAAGFSVAISSDIAGDVYAIGNSITISGRVGEDVSASGASVSLSGSGGIGGNARLAGASISVSTPVTGSVTIGAGNAIVSAPIGGDLYFAGDTISFSDTATVAGQVTIRSYSEVSVPASVAPPARVTIERVQPSEVAMGAGDIAQRTVTGFWPAWVPMIAALLAVVVLGVIWLALFPRRSRMAYRTATAKPWKSLGFGILALAAFIGLIPVVGMTVIGIPLIPVAVILLVLAGLLGYIAGAWILSTRVFAAFGMSDAPMANRTIAMLAGLVIAFGLGLVPFIGWLIQLTLVFFGLGAVAVGTLARWSDPDFERAVREEVAVPRPA